MDVNQPPVHASLVASVETAVAGQSPSGDLLLDLADELTYAVEAGLPYVNVVKFKPTGEPRRLLMGTSFCTRTKEADAIVTDMLSALGDEIDGQPVQAAGFTDGDQAYVDFVIGTGDDSVTGRLRITVYG